jgi:hypothetical protein
MDHENKPKKKNMQAHGTHLAKLYFDKVRKASLQHIQLK